MLDNLPMIFIGALLASVAWSAFVARHLRSHTKALNDAGAHVDALDKTARKYKRERDEALAKIARMTGGLKRGASKPAATGDGGSAGISPVN